MTCLVLLDALLLQTFKAESTADGLLGRADGLVQRALGTVGVILGDSAGGSRGKGAKLRRRVGGVVLEGGFVFVLVGFGLREVG